MYKKSITLWCLSCGKKIETTPLIGWNKKRCQGCADRKTRKANRTRQRNGRVEKDKKEPKRISHMREQKIAEVMLKKFLKSLDRPLPEVEGWVN